MEYVSQMQAWGWPARVEQVRFMAEDILTQKHGSPQTISKNWPQRFLDRHSQLKTKYLPPLDKERALAQDPRILAGWFDLYQRVKKEYNIKDENTYNMDEKGFQQGVTGKIKVMISKYEKNEYITQPGNREWVSLIECVSLDGRVLPPYIIFKAKQYQQCWFEEIGHEGFISTSDNGWTNNAIGLGWLEACFETSTGNDNVYLKDMYRLLCLDGHASHISTAAIQFALDWKIILLCLPAHTTHLLQPLDVGIFAPLAINYKNTMLRQSRLGGAYSIDKIKFIRYYLEARNHTFTPQIILSAWAKSGLLPFDPQLILQDFAPVVEQKDSPETERQNSQLSSEISVILRPTTPPQATISYTNLEGSKTIALTPVNTREVEALLQRIRAEVDPKVLEACKKVGNCAIYALTSLVIEKDTNHQLLELNRQRERKKQPKRVVDNGEAVVLTQAIIEERRNRPKLLTAKQQIALDEKQAAMFKRELLAKLAVDIFTYEYTKKTPKTTSKRKKSVQFISSVP